MSVQYHCYDGKRVIATVAVKESHREAIEELVAAVLPKLGQYLYDEEETSWAVRDFMRLSRAPYNKQQILEFCTLDFNIVIQRTY
jgi:hypothetical protein